MGMCCGCRSVERVGPRKLKEYRLVCKDGAEAREWRNRILQALSGGDPNVDQEPPRRKILALMNPVGGSGRAQMTSKWNKAKIILDKAHLNIKVIETERRMHAYDLLKDDISPGQYDGIITVSGDGLIHEALNGLMNRPDWKEFISSVTFGFIPAGSGNGLVKSIASLSGYECTIELAAYSIAKGRTLKMDLTELDLEYRPEKKLYMFLSLSWAYIADVDINSERMRWAGSARFTLWGVYRIVSILNYHAKFKFKGHQVSSKRKTQLQSPEDYKQIEMTGPFKHLLITNVPHISADMHTSPMSRPNDGVNDITIMSGAKSRAQMTRYVLKAETGEFFGGDGNFDPAIGMEYYKCTEFELKPTVKGPVPPDCDYQLPEGAITEASAIYSIDGEVHPAQNIKGKVIPSIFQIYY